MRVPTLTLMLPALLLAGCGVSAPTCDDADAIRQLKVKATGFLQDDPRLVAASLALEEQRKKELSAEREKCSSSANKNFKHSLKSDLGIDSDEVPNFSSDSFAFRRDDDFCSTRYRQLQTTDSTTKPSLAEEYTAWYNEEQCSEGFRKASISFDNCSALKVAEFHTKRNAAIAKLQFTIDEIRFKGSTSQGLVLMCAATIHTANPESGETTGEATYTVEQTTEGKPFVTLVKAWGKDAPKP
jgi:hypothetical protein